MFKFTHAFNAAEISLIMKIACQNRLPPDIIITRLSLKTGTEEKEKERDILIFVSLRIFSPEFIHPSISHSSRVP